MLKTSQALTVKQQAVVGQLLEQGCLLEGHFDFHNGWHGNTYLNAHPLLDDPYRIMDFAGKLKYLLPHELREATQAVVGPITGGFILANDLAIQLDSDRKRDDRRVQLVPVYKVEGVLSIRQHYQKLLRGDFHDLKGLKVVVVDDVCNTGQTIRMTRSLVEQYGATVLASLVIYDRMSVIEDLPNHYHLEEVAYDPGLVPANECLCNSHRIEMPFTEF